MAMASELYYIPIYGSAVSSISRLQKKNSQHVLIGIYVGYFFPFWKNRNNKRWVFIFFFIFFKKEKNYFESEVIVNNSDVWEIGSGIE